MRLMAGLASAGADFRVRSGEIGPTSRLEGRLRRPADDFRRCGRRVPSQCDCPGRPPGAISFRRRPARGLPPRPDPHRINR